MCLWPIPLHLELRAQACPNLCRRRRLLLHCRVGQRSRSSCLIGRLEHCGRRYRRLRLHGTGGGRRVASSFGGLKMPQAGGWRGGAEHRACHQACCCRVTAEAAHTCTWAARLRMSFAGSGAGVRCCCLQPCAISHKCSLRPKVPWS